MVFIPEPLEDKKPRPTAGITDFTVKAARPGLEEEPSMGRRAKQKQPIVLDYEVAFQKIVWVFRSVRAIYTNIGTVPLRAVTKNSDGISETNKSEKAKKLMALLNRPNSNQTGNDLIESIAMWMNIRECFIWMQFPDDTTFNKTKGVASNPPLNLFVLDASRVHKKFESPDGTGKLIGWDVRGHDARFIPAWQMIRIGMPNPMDNHRGLPPLHPAFVSADLEHASEINDAVFFKRGARLAGIVAMKDGELDGDRADAISSKLSALYSGVENAHQLAVLDSDVTFINLMAMQKDMDFSGLKKLNKEKIAGAFGVPMFLLSDAGDANRSNARQQRFMFWHDTLLPIMQDIQQKLSTFLAPHFGVASLEVEFDTTNVIALQDDRSEFADALRRISGALKDFVASHIVKPSEAREILREKFSLMLKSEIDAEMDEALAQALLSEQEPEEPEEDEDEPIEEGLFDMATKGNSESIKIVRELKNAVGNRFNNGARNPQELLPTPATENLLGRLKKDGIGGDLLTEELRRRLMDMEDITQESLKSFFGNIEDNLKRKES